MSQGSVRRTGVAAALASGVALLSIGATGLAGVDGQLETAVKKQQRIEKPQPARSQRADCPEKHPAAPQRDRS